MWLSAAGPGGPGQGSDYDDGLLRGGRAMGRCLSSPYLDPI